MTQTVKPNGHEHGSVQEWAEEYFNKQNDYLRDCRMKWDDSDVIGAILAAAEHWGKEGFEAGQDSIDREGHSTRNYNDWWQSVKRKDE